METISIVAITAVIISIVNVVISFRKIKIQRKQEEELLQKLEKKSSKYLKELIKNLEEGESLESLTELDGNLTKQELEIRDKLFEKQILKILSNYKENKFSEVKDALYYQERINKNYLNKIHKSLVKLSETKNSSKTKDEIIKDLIFQLEEQESLNSELRKRIESEESIKDRVKELNLSSKGRNFKINVNSISHIKAELDGCKVYTTNENIWIPIKLKEFSKMISSNKFIKIHRGTIVNIDYVNWVSNSSLMLSNGNEFKVGRTYKTSLMEAIRL